MDPIQIDARVASVTDVQGDDTQQAVTFDLDLDADMTHHGPWSGATHPGFAFAVNLHRDAVAGLEPGAPVTITIEPA